MKNLNRRIEDALNDLTLEELIEEDVQTDPDFYSASEYSPKNKHLDRKPAKGKYNYAS